MVTMVSLDNNTSVTNMTVVPEPSSNKPLNIAVMVSCGFTCLMAAYVIMLHIGYKLLKSGRSMIKLSLLSMLCLTEMCYVAGMKFTEITVVCTAMAAIFHLSCIATFTWLFSYILYLGNNLKKGYHSLSVGIYVMIGCVIPICFVLIPLIWRYQNYRETMSCWISSNNHLDWALKGPIVGIIFMSTVMLVYVVYIYLRLEDPKQVQIQCDRIEVIACAILLPSLGVTWLLGIFSATENVRWMGIAFAASNVLLGVIVFLSLCLFNVELTQARERQGDTYKKLKEKLTNSQKKDAVREVREGRKTRATPMAIMMSNTQILKDLRKQEESDRSSAYCVPETYRHEITPTQETQLFSPIKTDSTDPIPGTSQQHTEDPLPYLVAPKLYPDLDISDDETDFKTQVTEPQAPVASMEAIDEV